jgi:hypothetical protein
MAVVTLTILFSGRISVQMEGAFQKVSIGYDFATRMIRKPLSFYPHFERRVRALMFMSTALANIDVRAHVTVYAGDNLLNFHPCI